jgi:hypothetical protein
MDLREDAFLIDMMLTAFILGHENSIRYANLHRWALADAVDAVDAVG